MGKTHTHKTLRSAPPPSPLYVSSLLLSFTNIIKLINNIYVLSAVCCLVCVFGFALLIVCCVRVYYDTMYVYSMMHACGHDGHMAGLLGVARVLSENREKIAGTG